MNPKPIRLTLQTLPGIYAVCRFLPDVPLPTLLPPAPPGDLWSLTRTPGETSLVVAESGIPDGATAERDWRAVRVAGTLDFALVGIVANLTTGLADAGVSCFVLSTFDTDYLLVKADSLDTALQVWVAAGHTVEAA